MTFSMASDANQPDNTGKANFTVFGVGGGGGNAVEHMVRSGMTGVTFVCANTDKQHLDKMSSPHCVLLGAEKNRGLGAGQNPEIGKLSAESDEETIRQLLTGSDMVFITVGMGGGTGTGASPVIARIAKEMDILTVAVVTTPFSLEGSKRKKLAKAGIDNLVEYVDSIIIIPNDKVMKVYGGLSAQEAYGKANDILLNAVRGIADMVIGSGTINLDFADLRTAMSSKGHAMMGVGKASGDSRARQATEMAIKSPLLDDVVLKHAKGILINITAKEFTLEEQQQAYEVIQQIVDTDDEETDVFWGSEFDENMGDDMRITVIATGLFRDENDNSHRKIASSHDVDHGAHQTALSRQKMHVVDEPAPQVAPQAQVSQQMQQQQSPQQAQQRSSQNISVHDYLRQQHKNK